MGLQTGWEPAAPPAPPTAARRRYAAPLAAAGVTLAATAFVGLVDPGQPGHYPLCPLKSLTGLDCPGCGGLRAVHDLVHGDLAGALDQNLAVVVMVLPVAVVSWVLWLRRIRRGDAAPTGRADAASSRWRRAAPYLFLALLLVFTVVRNLPFVPYLRSGIG